MTNQKKKSKPVKLLVLPTSRKLLRSSTPSRPQLKAFFKNVSGNADEREKERSARERESPRARAREQFRRKIQP